MTLVGLAKEVKEWMGEDEAQAEVRAELMRKEAPIGESTLRAIISGRYIPAERLEKAIRGVMRDHPTGQKVSATPKAAIG